MKKALVFALACLFALSAVLPCLAADVQASKPVALGAWPQSLVTGEKESSALSAKLRLTNARWQSAVLPDGSAVQFCDVGFLPFTDLATNRPSYRAVRIGTDAVQWYRWEPLTWKRAKVGNVYVLICTSVVSVASYSGPNPVMKGDPNADAIYAWLTQDFYASAFSDSEKSAFMTVTLPLYSLTCGSAAAVGDYAALCGANGSSYLQMQLPDETAQETEKTTPAFVQTQTKGSPAKAKQISIRPMLIEIEIEGGGLINFLRRLFGW